MAGTEGVLERERLIAKFLRDSRNETIVVGVIGERSELAGIVGPSGELFGDIWIARTGERMRMTMLIMQMIILGVALTADITSYKRRFYLRDLNLRYHLIFRDGNGRLIRVVLTSEQHAERNADRDQ